MTKDEALDLALEPIQEPVGWFGYSPAHDAWFHTNEGDDDSIPLYKAPPKRTEQNPVAWRVKNFYENAEGWFYADWHPDGLIPQIAELLYTTPPATPVQEPSGFFRHEDVCGDEVGPATPYYLTPPAAQRQWVGLTDEEVYPLANEHLHYQMEGYEVSGIYNLAQAIETKLKEKNT
jgi:hypothetical protein